MDTPYIKAKARIDDLHRRVREKCAPEFAEIDRLTAFMEMFEELASDDMAASTPAPAQESPATILLRSVAAIANAAQATKKARVTAFCFDAINAYGPTQTRKLLELLDAGGLGDCVVGRDRVVSLSGMLSRDDRFESDRAAGWSIKSNSPQGELSEQAGS